MLKQRCYYSSSVVLSLALVAGSVTTATPDALADDNKQLTSAFALTSSVQSRFAEQNDEATFYVQLQVNNLRPDLKDTKCVDTGFFAWVRKFFKNDAKTITIVASITGPDGATQKIPLFQLSKDETAKPPQCLTDVLTSRPITQLFVARRTGAFHLDVQALTQQNVTVTLASTTVNAASDLLSLTGGSAWLVKNVASSQAVLGAAVSKVDSSLSMNWSQSNQEVFRFDIGPWPLDGDWAHHNDQATFAVGSLIPGAMGIKVDDTLLPTVSISPVYTISVFGGGPGHYLGEDDILATHLTLKGSDPLDAVFKLGLPGFSTDNALTISDQNAMRSFCTNMRSNFSNFLTTDDALAARHAVLVRRTVFFNSSELQKASNCESAADVTRLKQLNANFEFPDNIARADADNRSAFVTHRGTQLLTPALINPSKDKITSIVADPTKFTVLISNDVLNIFPSNGSGIKAGGATGDPAISELVAAGAFRNGCWAALPTQNLRNLVGVVLNKTTNNGAGIVVEFDKDYPGPGTDPSKDTAKVTKISFLPVSTIQAITQFSDWPGDSCPLI